MWQTTKHGLYKQFNFKNFHEAWGFMVKVAELADREGYYPRWENNWSVVQIWLITHQATDLITDRDHSMAKAIDNLYAGRTTEQVITQSKPQVQHVKVFADGGSRGNPGPSASGYVILTIDDSVLVDEGVYLGITTNNQAEYTALKLALEKCVELRAEEVNVYMDSMLVVNQMKGIFKIKNRELWPIHDAIKQLVVHFSHITFQHVPREFNKAADAAVNRALDEALGINN